MSSDREQALEPEVAIKVIENGAGKAEAKAETKESMKRKQTPDTPAPIPEPPQKRPRGRPPGSGKKQALEAEKLAVLEKAVAPVAQTPVKKKGRRKNPAPARGF